MAWVLSSALLMGPPPNIEHSTPNIEHRTQTPLLALLGAWMLRKCSVRRAQCLTRTDFPHLVQELDFRVGNGQLLPLASLERVRQAAFDLPTCLHTLSIAPWSRFLSRIPRFSPHIHIGRKLSAYKYSSPTTLITNMDWSEIAGLCQTELERMRADLPAPGSFFPSPDRLPAAFLSCEQETNQAVEVAVRQFAAHRTWPVMSPIERTMLCFRLELAAALAGLLAEQPAPWTDSAGAQHDEQRLGWLMLFAWGQEGFSLLHETLGRLIPSEGKA